MQKKVYIKNPASIATSKFAKTLDLANLKAHVDKLDIDKL